MKIVVQEVELNLHMHVTEGELPLSHKRVKVIVCDLHKGPCMRAEKPCLTPNVAVGVAYLSPHDRDRHVVGRKIAISRALHVLGLTKRERTLFWAAYIAKMGKPRSRR